MTTEDIRVIRPACEKLFGYGIRKDAEMSIMLINYFLARPGDVLPIDEHSTALFVKKLYSSPEFKAYLKTSKFRGYYKGMGYTEILAELFIQIKEMVGSFFCEIYDSVCPYIKIPEPERNVYIFEGRFFDQFSKVSVKNLTTSHLPQKGCGCMVLPRPLDVKGHRLKINEVIFNVGYHEFKKNCLKRPIENGIVAPGHPQFEQLNSMVNEPDVLSASFVGVDTKEGSVGTYGTFSLAKNAPLKFGKERLLTYAVDSIEDTSAFQLVTNLMAYINSGKPDIREFKNTVRYRGKSTVHVRPEDEELSRGKIFLVGFNWLKNPVYAVDGWWSSGYMSWRMCGPGRKEPRLVYFKGSFKQRRKGREDIITEESAVEGEDFVEC